MVYLISGKARHGKDTFAGFMKDYYESIGKKACIMHISNYIKHFAIDYFGWDGKEETKPRTLLQELGTDVIRVKMGKELFFINRLLEDMEVLENFYDVFIVSDVRLPIEFEEIGKHHDTVNIHINRINYESVLSTKEQKHITETALDNYDDYDYRITNDTLDKLKEDAEKLVKEVEKI
ncbi:MAG: hypothetical protein IJH13_02315 [Bacilli bacterium]|nr:hypothetical protein [Bacilli bacterium]